MWFIFPLQSLDDDIAHYTICLMSHLSEKSVIIILVSSCALIFSCPSWQQILFFNPRNLHYSVFASGHECPNIHTYTRAVRKQTKTHINASGSCHNRPPLMEWCLINRRLAAKEWRYLSHFYWAMVTVLLLSTSKCFPPWSIRHIHTGSGTSQQVSVTIQPDVMFFMFNMLL